MSIYAPLNTKDSLLDFSTSPLLRKLKNQCLEYDREESRIREQIKKLLQKNNTGCCEDLKPEARMLYQTLKSHEYSNIQQREEVITKFDNEEARLEKNEELFNTFSNAVTVVMTIWSAFNIF